MHPRNMLRTSHPSVAPLERVARRALKHASRPWSWEPVAGVEIAISGPSLVIRGEGGFTTSATITDRVRHGSVPSTKN